MDLFGPPAGGDVAVTSLTITGAGTNKKTMRVTGPNFLSLYQADNATTDWSSDASGAEIARASPQSYWGGSMASPVAPAVHPGYISGNAYPLGPQAATAAAVGGVDILYLLPFFVSSLVTPSAFGLRVVTLGVASAIKLGVWANNLATMRPTGVPIMSNNTGLATTASGTNVRLTVAGVPLTPGVMYWIGMKQTGTLPTVTMLGSASAFIANLLGSGVLNSTNQTTGVSAPDAYANDISATNLTSATFTTLSGAAVPLYEMVV
jgi:hypothetical protein